MKPELRTADGKIHFYFSGPKLCSQLRKQEETSLRQRGAALCTGDTEGHRDPRVGIVGKTGVEVFGVFYVWFCFKCILDNR